MKSFLIIALLALGCALSLAQADVIKQSDPQALLVSLSSVGNKSNVLNQGKTVTTSGLQGVVVADYTASSTNVYYVNYLELGAMISGATVTTATDLGYLSLESPAGTKLIRDHFVAYQGDSRPALLYFSEPIPIPAGQRIRVVADPSYVGSVEYRANFGGYER